MAILTSDIVTYLTMGNGGASGASTPAQSLGGTISTTVVSSTSGTGGTSLNNLFRDTNSQETVNPGPLATPVNSAFTTTTTGGVMTSGIKYYRISATNTYGETLASTETGINVPAGTSTNTVTVNWGAVSGATGYRIYGRGTGAELFIAAVGAVTTYLDTGSITPSGALPSSNTTAVKVFRAISVKNNSSQTYITPRAYISIATTLNPNEYVEMAYDSADTQFIANETTAPTGLTFSLPTSVATGVALPDLAAGTSARIWLRRTTLGGGVIVTPTTDAGELQFYGDTNP